MGIFPKSMPIFGRVFVGTIVLMLAGALMLSAFGNVGSLVGLALGLAFSVYLAVDGAYSK